MQNGEGALGVGRELGLLYAGAALALLGAGACAKLESRPAPAAQAAGAGSAAPVAMEPGAPVARSEAPPPAAPMPAAPLSASPEETAKSRGAPLLRQGATQVSGRLPPEVIQRIVRQNFGRFRLCYENGLKSNPHLQGKVSIRFVISARGEVSSVADGGSDLPDPSVVSCIQGGFRGLSFPEPESGTVTVVYPMHFSPGG